MKMDKKNVQISKMERLSPKKGSRHCIIEN
jgi:hypothetical protein